jgi:hypothetical protein
MAGRRGSGAGWRAGATSMIVRISKHSEKFEVNSEKLGLSCKLSEKFEGQREIQGQSEKFVPSRNLSEKSARQCES